MEGDLQAVLPLGPLCNPLGRPRHPSLVRTLSANPRLPSHSGESFDVAVHLEELGEGIFHEEDRLILHHLVILRGLRRLPTEAGNDMQQYLLVLRYRLALLCQEVLGFVAKLFVETE